MLEYYDQPRSCPGSTPDDRPGLHLMIPGPCQLHPHDLELLGGQVEPHYGPAWSARHEAVLAGLRRLLGAPHTYLVPGSGTCSLDAALFNLFEPGHRVAVPDTGCFGRRLVAMARAHELEVVQVPVRPGHPADPRRVAPARTASSTGSPRWAASSSTWSPWASTQWSPLPRWGLGGLPASASSR